MRGKTARSPAGDVLYRFVMVTLAAVIISVNMKSFVQAGDLFPGGFTGLARLAQRTVREFLGMDLPFGPINLLLNAVPAAISFKFVGKKFTLYSCQCILLVSIFTDLVPSIPITEDMLLISVFGGLITGFAVSLCLRARATTGGTDFIAIALSERKNMDAWNYILAGNVVMLSVAGMLFGWEKALYSIIFQFASTQTVRLLDPDSGRVTLFIVTGRELASDVCSRIQDTHHTATLIEGTGLYNGKPCVMIYTVVSAGESKGLVRKVRQADPNAFVNVIHTERIHGNFYRRPRD